ncbi:hypothetical protein JCM9279_000687 [Rhodotorula babjevae]
MSDAGAPPDTHAPPPVLSGGNAVAPPPPPSSTGSGVVYDTGPRHPNDAAPGRVTKGGSLLTGGYLASKIYVGNLPDSATLADLEDCFGQIGPCTCTIKRGFGFVEYVDPAHAAEAVAKYNEGHFLGSQIKVELSLARQPLAKDELKALANRNGAQPNAPGSDRPSDPRKPMWINGGPGGAPPGRGQRGGSGGPPPDFARDRYGPGPSAPGYGPPVGYGAPRYDERSPYDRPPMPGYGPPREYDRYGPPPPMPHPGYGPPPMDRPPYDPYYDRAPAYPPPYPPVPVPGYPPAAPYDRPPYPPAPLPHAAGGPRDPYAERYPPGPPPPGAGRSPVVPSRGSVPPAEPARAPYPPVDPYARPPPDMPPSGAYDPRDERGAGARYQPYPPREDRGYGGRSPSRGAPSLERRRSMSPRRNGSGDPHARDARERDPYARDPYGPPPSAAGGYAPYDSRGPPPMPPSGYGPPPGGRSPPRYPPVDEYVPRR